MTTAEGFFGKPTFLGIGDEYDKRKKFRKDEKSEVKPFLSSGAAKSGPTALFDKNTLSLAQGDPYIDPALIERRVRNSQKKEDVKPFIISGKSNKSIVPGMLGEYPKHEPEFVSTKKEVKKKDDEGKGSYTFTTKPAPKGGYGYVGTTIGGSTYKYICDPYDDRAALKAQFRTSTKAKDEKAVPFKSAVSGIGTLDRFERTGADRIYSLPKALPAKKPQAVLAAPEKPPVPWKPSAPCRKAKEPMGQGKFPEYVPDPVDVRPPNLKEKGDDKNTGHWTPSAGTKTKNTRSIAFNAQLAYR